MWCSNFFLHPTVSHIFDDSGFSGSHNIKIILSHNIKIKEKRNRDIRPFLPAKEIDNAQKAED